MVVDVFVFAQAFEDERAFANATATVKDDQGWVVDQVRMQSSCQSQSPLPALTAKATPSSNTDSLPTDDNATNVEPVVNNIVKTHAQTLTPNKKFKLFSILNKNARVYAV